MKRIVECIGESLECNSPRLQSGYLLRRQIGRGPVRKRYAH